MLLSDGHLAKHLAKTCKTLLLLKIKTCLSTITFYKIRIFYSNNAPKFVWTISYIVETNTHTQTLIQVSKLTEALGDMWRSWPGVDHGQLEADLKIYSLKLTKIVHFSAYRLILLPWLPLSSVYLHWFPSSLVFLLLVHLFVSFSA